MMRCSAMIYKFGFVLIALHFAENDGQESKPKLDENNECWSEWFSRDDPSGSGDWETLHSLRRENPQKICSYPVKIQAETTSGKSVESTGDVIYVADTTTGFICKNYQQVRGRCNDYRVRFMCPVDFCSPNECWTQWFDRDNPSGSGDWETLDALRLEHPNKICEDPLQIQVQTTSGLSVDATGNVVEAHDTATGFICKNSDQLQGTCSDFQVRFQCPGEFCFEKECWTNWFDIDDDDDGDGGDDDVGSGDWETLSVLNREHPDEICKSPLEIEVQTTTGRSAALTGDEIKASDTITGFVCRNADQEGGRCEDYRVRFKCPLDFCTPEDCWTGWFDRDNPSGSGDWEFLPALRREYSGKICNNPLEIDVQTATGLSVDSTGDVISVSDVNVGFICKNADQPDGRCDDYRVRFKCPHSYCQEKAQTCWTQWFNRDDPSGSGDWETLSLLHWENPNKICSNPLQIDVETTSGKSVASTGDVIFVSDTSSGFICKNYQQRRGVCQDYRVRFMCPDQFCYQEGPVCWTEWFDLDNPTGEGDFETLADLRRDSPRKICNRPLQIDVQTTTGLHPESTGNVFYASDARTGFICVNSEQKDGQCEDYRVRFRCPMDFCDKTDAECWTDWFDRDDPSGPGDTETLPELRLENPEKICVVPLYTEAETTDGQSVDSTGDVIQVSDTDTGFICRNSDQKDAPCHDYRVRFMCPLDFCDEMDTGCWTGWFDRDDPSGSGDWEVLSLLRKRHPFQICDEPLRIDVQTTSGLSVASTGDVIHVSDVVQGFICKNSDQVRGMCGDYRVRFMCPKNHCNQKECWTPWFDRDDPSGTGDWELLRLLKKANPGQICETPAKIEVVTRLTNTPASATGQKFAVNSPTQGFVCLNNQQKEKYCKDYKVRFACPCP